MSDQNILQLALDNKIRHLQWDYKKSSNEDLLFYHLKNDEKSISKFKELYPSFKYKLLVLDNAPPADLKVEKFILIEPTDMLKTQKLLADHYYPVDFEHKKMVGITGTNGKTTTVNLAMQISILMGHPAFSVGTLGIKTSDGNIISIAGMTTPPYLELRKQFFELFKTHDVAFLEASSHALDQGRLFEFKFDVGAWTSFTQDHLDYHGSMDEYFKIKSLLITSYLKEGSPFFVPDEQGELRKKLSNLKIKSSMLLKDRHVDVKKLPLFFHSQFNQNNLEIALNVNEALWGKLPEHIDFDSLKLPDGRFNVYNIKGRTVIIDYAHTPDAIENICKTIKKDLSFEKLFIVFGCGGDRDRTKRPLMGMAASRYADQIFVTTDNPRFEEIEDIIDDIMPGLDLKKTLRISDRTKAIHAALTQMDANNTVLLIAGKGHEDYLDIKGVKYPYSDLDVIKKF